MASIKPNAELRDNTYLRFLYIKNLLERRLTMNFNAKVKKTFDTGKLKAVFDVTLEDEFVIHEVKLIEGQKGRFVSMPSEKWSGEQGRVRRVDIAHPLNAKVRAALFAAIEDAYENHLKNISENENTIKTN